MNSKKIRPNLLTFIIILTIIGGILGIIRSFPIFSLYTSIKQGGIKVNDNVTIQDIQINSPAEQAQFLSGDKIISINGTNITNSSEVINLTDENKGKEVTIVIERNGSIQTVKVIPRINPPPNEGKLGVVLIDATKLEKKPIFALIPQIIIQSYSGFEEMPTQYNLTQTQIFRDRNFIRLQSLIFGIVSLVLGIGLWKWKKWALYGYIFSTGYSVIASIPYLANPKHYSNTRQIHVQSILNPALNTPNILDFSVVIFGLIIDILCAYYIFRKRKLFE